jgi:hypothetical protein
MTQIKKRQRCSPILLCLFAIDAKDDPNLFDNTI